MKKRIIGGRIKERRKALQLNQQQLSELAEISQTQISRYEIGENEPTAEVIAQLAEALKTSADYLIGITDDPSPKRQIDNLTTFEAEIIAAMRRGDKAEAARIILNS